MDKLISIFILFLIVPNLLTANTKIDGENNYLENIPFLQDSVNNYESQDESLQLNDLSTVWRLSFDSIKMPDKDGSMGLIGFYYLAKVSPFINGGIVGYSAISGNQGGLFVFGIEGNIYRPLISKLLINYGLFVGGGGGKVGTGNGFMMRSHIGLSYDFERFKVGANYSYVTFPDSKIQGKQVGLSIAIPTQFYYANPNFIGRTINDLNMLKHISSSSNIVFNRIYMGIIVKNYFQEVATKNTFGEVQDNTIWLTGFELGRFMTKNTYILLKTSGAFKGNPHGYMDFLAGFGYNYPFIAKYLSLSGKITAGSGGGGYVETGGGLLVETNIGLTLNFTPNIAMQIDGGYLNSPKGNLKAISLTSKLLYSIETASIAPTTKKKNAEGIYTFNNWAIRITNQVYIHPKRNQNIADDNVHLICVKFDKLLNKYIFLTGQAHSAYSGNYVGGYAAGLVGVGIQSKTIFNDQVKVNAEMLIGAGGGGHLAIGQGAIAQSVFGITYNFTNYFSLRMST
ncbi:MAG: hypothetical protein VX789_03480, partial [Candidatus Neomarinimicrobiota bacterium]|nr:hypothetical protein [Candidatus Neomarinimicrobiota bacterium]